MPSKLDLLRETLSVAAQTVGEHVQKLIQWFESETCLCGKCDLAGDLRWRKQFHAFKCAATASIDCQKRMER